MGRGDKVVLIENHIHDAVVVEWPEVHLTDFADADPSHVVRIDRSQIFYGRVGELLQEPIRHLIRNRHDCRHANLHVETRFQTQAYRMEREMQPHPIWNRFPLPESGGDQGEGG
jgi:hypothetical protein